MSVAFVKEPNEDQVEVLPDRDLGTDPNLVTARGLRLIDEAMAALEGRLEAARGEGDKVAMAGINRDLRYWRARRASAQLVPPPETGAAAVFGTRVTIERPDGRVQAFEIVGIDEADPSRGLVSFLSPIARNLIGSGVGDEVTAGSGKAEIVAVAPLEAV